MISKGCLVRYAPAWNDRESPEQWESADDVFLVLTDIYKKSYGEWLTSLEVVDILCFGHRRSVSLKVLELVPQ